MNQLLGDAINASSLNGLMRGTLLSLFTLTRNGEAILTGAAAALDAPVVMPPEGAGRARPEASDLALIERLGESSVREVAKGTATASSSLTDEQDRTLNPSAVCTLRDDGIKEIEQLLYSPRGSRFRFLSEEAPANGGQGRAPDAATFISAGIGFCFMT